VLAHVANRRDPIRVDASLARQTARFDVLSRTPWKQSRHQRHAESCLAAQATNCDRAARIVIEVTRTRQELTLTVRDEEPGIAVDQRRRIFEIYVHLNQGNILRVGHGLGLVFCRLAIEAQGGRIWVEGVDNDQGAAFHAVLPVD
jgi:two-component system sensor histidine kinase/response regulator